jgi:spectinomycin phosphotransferase
MLTEPRDLDRSELEQALADRWGLRDPQLDYLAVGFGSHHWRATDSRGTRGFATWLLPGRFWRAFLANEQSAAGT